MPNLGPQQFPIDVGDQLYQTLSPNDPIIGISVSATVPVTIPWNLSRTELEKEKDKEKEVVFGKTRWSDAGPGPHDVYTDKIGGQRVKIGTVSWEVTTDCFQEVETNGSNHRWRITPCPILSRTFTPLQGAPTITEVVRNPQACYGNWVTTPAHVAAALAHSLVQPALPATVAAPATKTQVARTSSAKKSRRS